MADPVILVIASGLIYCAGLFLNDWFDLARDRQTRPGRPLPSGRIPPILALVVGIALLAAGPLLAAAVGFHSFLTALFLAALVVLYDAGAKHNTWLGPGAMGLCRAMNVVLGASIALTRGGVAPVVVALVEGGYVAMITLAAAHETEGRPEPLRRVAPVAFLACGLAGYLSLTTATPLGVAAAMGALAFPAWALVHLASQKTANVPQYIGRLIRSLIPLQASFILVTAPGCWPVAASIVLLLPLAWIGSRRFAGS
jgi:4-hydroxybenzoate polyprenyltransferase